MKVKWLRQIVHPRLDLRRALISACMNLNFRAPIPIGNFNLRLWLLSDDVELWKKVERHSQACQQLRPVITPRIVIGGRDKITDVRPLPVFYMRDQVFAMKAHLPFRLPKPDEIDTDDEGQNQAGIKASAKITGHDQS